MNVVIYNGNLKPTTFVLRLAKVVNEEHKTLVFGTSSKLLTYKKNDVSFVPTDANNKFLLLAQIFLKLIRFFCFYPKKCIHFVSLLSHSKKPLRTRFKQFLIWSKAISCRAEIVHIQWASHIYLFEEILDTTYFKIMVSLRGSLINIAPVADDDLLNLYRKTFPRVHLFHAVSEHIKTLATFYGAVEDNIKVIYSGVDLSSFEPLKKKNYFRGDELKILSVGRHHWNKGYNYALEAFSIILKQNIKATYTIIGVSNSEEIICSGNYLDLKDNLILTPYMNYNNVLTAMQTADVLLLPSVSEGVANVAIEAMAIGLPIISTNAAGMPELITHNKTGLLYDNRSINDLVEKLLNFNNMPQKDIENMSENALQKIAQQHNWATFKRAFGDFYKN